MYVDEPMSSVESSALDCQISNNCPVFSELEEKGRTDIKCNVFYLLLQNGRRCDAKCYRFSVDNGNHNGKDGNEDKDGNNDMIRDNYDEVTMVLIMTIIITIITLTILDVLVFIVVVVSISL